MRGNPYETFLRRFDEHMTRARRGDGFSVGNRGMYPGYGVGQTSAPRPTSGAMTHLRARTGDGGGGGGGKAPCGSDPTAPMQGGYCVCGPDECEYDPAIFCGWAALPFSTWKDQGDPPFEGTVPAAWAGLRTVRITSERACRFRVRGLWMRSYENDGPGVGLSLLGNVEINRVPRVLEIGDNNAPNRIGIPTSLWDNTFWVMPVAWGILGPINNQSRPLELTFATPVAANQNVAGVLFGDPIDEGGNAVYGNHAMNWT